MKKKIAIVGPECSGKSTLAEQLAGFYETAWVKEYAREFFDTKKSTDYVQADLLTIARGQIAAEEAQLKKAKSLLICDTNLLVIEVWSEYKYKTCAEEIKQLHRKQTYDFYLVTSPDIPWQDDPLREHPDKREYFFNLYIKKVLDSSVPFHVVNSTGHLRTLSAIMAVKQALYGR